MNSLKRNILLALVTSFLIMTESIFFPLTYAHGEFLDYKGSRIERDRFNRIVYSPEQGQINYSQADLINNLTIKNPLRAKSIFFVGAPQNILGLDMNTFVSSSRLKSQDSIFKEVWSVGFFGNCIGKSSFVTADIDNDGIVEIISGGSTSIFGSNNYWYIIEYSSISQKYDIKWTSEFYSEGISTIAAFDVKNSGIFNIFIGLSNGNIYVYEGSTLEEIDFIQPSNRSINRILFADADNDATKEIVCCSSDNTLIFHPISLSLEQTISYGSNDFEIGNVDSDDLNEIVLASGLVLEYDGLNTIVEWNYGEDFGYLIELSDIDSDNMEEIIAASSWYYVNCFEADIQSPKWQINADLDVDALLVTDVDNDGIEEVLYGDGQHGDIHCYDAITLNRKWRVKNPDSGVTDIAVCDTDDDGDLELLWGAGAGSTGADHLYIHGIPTLSLEWNSQHVDGPFYPIDVGDVDSDGHKEIVFASFESNSGYDDGIIFIYDAETHNLEWNSNFNTFGDYAWTGIHDLKIGDVDNDGVQEIAVATDKLYDGAIYIINGISREMEQSYFYDDGAPMYTIDIADIDNDNEMEIIAGGGREHTGAPGVYIYVINGSTGTVEWKSISLGDYWSDFYTIKAGDIDGDGIQEIVGINDRIFVFDGISHQMWKSSFAGCYGLDLSDTDNDIIKEIIVGTIDGRIVAIDGQTYSEKFNIEASTSLVYAIRAFDLNEDGINEFAIASQNQLSIYNIHCSCLIWQTNILGSSAGKYNNLVVSDIDSDEAIEILIGTNYTVHEFKSDLTTMEDNDKDGVTFLDGDCDDEDPNTYPGAPELCDGKDNDCDVSISPDELDQDADGYRGCQGDCDDLDNTIYPGASELCDGKDNDCDGSTPINELDIDADGYRVCNYDCNNYDNTMYPGAPELCDGKDNNCDGEGDVEGTKGCTIYYKDDDNDGQGVDGDSRCLCSPDELNNYMAIYSGDPDDLDPNIQGTILTGNMGLPYGWSMISLPLIPDNASVSSLFPDAVIVYGFEKGRGYVRVKEEENMEVGKGYWILLIDAKTYTITGEIVDKYNFTVQNGWDMIGGCTSDAQASGDNCNIGLIYEFKQEYGYIRVLASENLQPGKGYWIMFQDVADQCELKVEIIEPNI